MRKDYNPIPVYNRKYARNIIRAQIIKRNGYHNVSESMSRTFKEMHHPSVAEEPAND